MDGGCGVASGVMRVVLFLRGGTTASSSPSSITTGCLRTSPGSRLVPGPKVGVGVFVACVPKRPLSSAGINIGRPLGFPARALPTLGCDVSFIVRCAKPGPVARFPLMPMLGVRSCALVDDCVLDVPGRLSLDGRVERARRGGRMDLSLSRDNGNRLPFFLLYRRAALKPYGNVIRSNAAIP
jgi:hypothetical protein